MFRAALFTIPQSWKRPKCSSVDEFNTMWYFNTMEYYLAIKNKNIIQATAWMKLLKTFC